MSKRGKTSEKLLNSIRKTKENAQAETESAAPANAAPPVVTVTQTETEYVKKDKEPEVRRIFSSRRVWPD